MNQNKISVRERNQAILQAKKIISFCKSGCNLERSFFLTLDELFEETENICRYGDISSVRRAVRLMNENFKEKNFKIKFSDETCEILQIKENIKKYSQPTLQVTRGKILVEF